MPSKKLAATVPLSAYNTDLGQAIKLLKQWKKMFGLPADGDLASWYPAHQNMNDVKRLGEATKDFIDNV